MSNGTGALEEELMRTGEIVFSNRGRSMMPLIREGKDLVVIKKCRGRLKKYDVPLYRKDEESPHHILHRIIKVTPDGYVIRGDNCYFKEYGITDANIIGVLTAVVRNGKEIPMTSAGMKIYGRVWVFIYPLRFVVFKGKRGVLKVLRLFRRKKG